MGQGVSAKHVVEEATLNDVAIRCFRDIADGDYIAARLASRAALVPQFLWSSQQAIEKYLKCILLLNRIQAPDVGHNLELALKRIQASKTVKVDLCKPTAKFIEQLDTYGRFRYLEVSHSSQGADLLTLDRAVWELRQHCTLNKAVRPQKVVEGVLTPVVRLPGGYLERVLAEERGRRRGSARSALVWQNGFFTDRKRRFVRLGGWMSATYSPFWRIPPEALAEVARYVYVPKQVVKSHHDYYREGATTK